MASTTTPIPPGPASPATAVVVTVGIAGGTGAGKTTLARQLYAALGGHAHVTHLVHDSYYKDLRHQSLAQRAATNFDCPSSLDTALLVTHVQQLKRGVAVHVPTYDFATHARTDTTTLESPRPILLIEGILILSHPELVQEMDIKIYVEADPEIRLFRRIQRDAAERGRTMESVWEQYQTTVKPMHDAHVEPSKKIADLIVHSSSSSSSSSSSVSSLHLVTNILANHLRVVANLELPHASLSSGVDNPPVVGSGVVDSPNDPTTTVTTTGVTPAITEETESSSL